MNVLKVGITKRMAKAKEHSKAETKQEAKEAPKTDTQEQPMLDVKVEGGDEVKNEPKDEKLELLAANLQSHIRSYFQLVCICRCFYLLTFTYRKIFMKLGNTNLFQDFSTSEQSEFRNGQEY